MCKYVDGCEFGSVCSGVLICMSEKVYGCVSLWMCEHIGVCGCVGLLVCLSV